MNEIEQFHPAVATAIRYFGNSSRSMQEVASEFNITKQAAQKRIAKAREYFLAYDPQHPNLKYEIGKFKEENNQLKQDLKKKETLIQWLSQLLTLRTTLIFMKKCFEERIQQFFPRFKLSRLRPDEKMYILNAWFKFQKLDGKLKDFCSFIGKSPDTIRKWLSAYEEHGIAGLQDKTTRPKHFSNKIPRWLKEQLLILFSRFPNWSSYQYYQYMKHNPAIHYSISVETIKKIKRIHTEKTQAEKERIKKRWSFDSNSDVWTVDFTCIEKTEKYKLQLLTVSDQRSRFFFESVLLLDTSTKIVMDHLEELFIKYGKPFMIKADNGPEFRMEYRDKLSELSIYLLNSPKYYGQFNGAHERKHRSLKSFITDFCEHRNITKLANEIREFTENHNHQWPHKDLKYKTPAEIFYGDPSFIPEGVEVVTPYKKDGELRMKFTGRNGKPARISIPEIKPS